MSRQGYSYSAQAAPVRHSSNHSTSSAFSSSANADEDWTQISDLAERRRIQNRIAQRNYRKKLKRRLEDLERRAGSSSASPPPAHTELKQAPKKEKRTDSYKSSAPSQRHNMSQPRQIPQQQYSPPMQHDEDVMFNSYDKDHSQSPPMFTYSTYPAPEDAIYSSYQSYRQGPIIQSSEAYNDYMVPAPTTLPSMMQFREGIKREPMLDDTSMNPFSMSYAAMAGMDMHAASSSHGYDDSNPHTPPLSHSFEGSEYGYPSTPLSMPGSPGMLQQY